MRWNHPEKAPTTEPTEMVRLPEVFVGGEGLVRGPAAVLGTLLHEAAIGATTCTSRSRKPGWIEGLGGRRGECVAHVDEDEGIPARLPGDRGARGGPIVITMAVLRGPGLSALGAGCG